uniref:Ig-like domain-containing protein n=1 Tax=Vombatus ursinus TaxID=29139 RepID=A0A4X2KRZ6_VOMUR
MASEGPRWYVQLVLFMLCLTPYANAESHRLQYNLFAMVSSDGEPPSYSAHGYLDDELFLHYDSESQRPEPRGTWLDGLVETDTWKKEKSNVKEIGQDFKITLRQIMDQSNLNTAFPLLNVTQKENREGKVTLRCCAYSFVPRDIKMTWLQNGHALSHSDHERGIIQPSGDGTYQTWVSIDVHSEESNYTCHVEHQGRNQTISVPLGPVPEASRKYWVLAALTFAGVIAIPFVVFFCGARYRERRQQQDGLPV